MSLVPLGTIVAFALSHAMIPEGWLLCDGRLINDGPTERYELADYMDNTPNLCARTLIGTGTPNNEIQNDGNTPGFITPIFDWPLGYTGGEYQHTLIKDEIPKHIHDVQFGWAEASGTFWKNLARVDGAEMTAKTKDGGEDGLKGQAHFNMQPYHAVNYIIYAHLLKK